jgi:hypothetical protein
MKTLQFTLVTDGPSDGWMLIPILEWLLRLYCVNFGIKVVYADLRNRKIVPTRLDRKVAFAIEAYPCDCLFIHRDAEKASASHRQDEIGKAIAMLDKKSTCCHICVIPIRMTEAWLLFDEHSIRRASGNPNGKTLLKLPHLSEVEQKPDPKKILHDLLTDATEFAGRRRKSFDPKTKTRFVAQTIDDFSPLRELSGFLALESDVRKVVEQNQWDAID